MKHFDLRRIDLNLLITFDALMTARSVTGAAERLGLGQPAVSHSLARLRKLTGDSLFVASRRGLVPTNRALGIAAWGRSVLEEAQQKLLQPPPFNPAEWSATVHINMTPMMDAALMPRLLRQLAAKAPNVHVTVHASEFWRDIVNQLDDGVIDLYVGFAAELKPWHRQQTLWEENVLALFSPARLKLPSPLELNDYLSCRHILVMQRGGELERYVDDALAKIGKQRRIVFSTPHHMVVPYLLLEVPVLATMHGRAARWFARAFKLKTSPVPADIASFKEAMVWNEVVDRDPAQVWLRHTIFNIARSL